MGTTAPRRLGRYRLIERLGRGGTAEVWKVVADGPAGWQRTRVMKRLLPERAADRAFVAMLVDEAKLSARLDHANIVRVFDLEQVGDEYLLTMELVEGCELRALLAALDRRGTPSVGLAIYVAREIARGLAYAHALTDDAGQPLGIVHRDVSPSNILCSHAGAVKLADFGIARALDGSRSDGPVQGNLAYMAPEQLAGATLDARADVYALGVTLHECLTARRLWKGAYDVESMKALRARPVPAPSTINPAVPASLDEICAKAVSEDPAQRFSSVRDFGDALAKVGETFGATELAAMMKELAPTMRATPPTEPSRRTLTHAGTRRGRGRWIVGAALVLVVGVAVFKSFPSPLTPRLTPAAVAPSSSPSPSPVENPNPPPPAPPQASSPAPPPPSAHRTAKHGHSPNLVGGKLVNPFAGK